MPYRYCAPVALLSAALLLSGCASDSLLSGPNGSITTTSALTAPANPVCLSLSSQIDTLRAEGVAEKIEKAAAKKYKMTTADLAKADQLTKANADFQSKCSTLPAKPATASVGPANPSAAGASGPGKASAAATTAFASPAKQ